MTFKQYLEMLNQKKMDKEVTDKVGELKAKHKEEKR